MEAATDTVTLRVPDGPAFAELPRVCLGVLVRIHRIDPAELGDLATDLKAATADLAGSGDLTVDYRTTDTAVEVVVSGPGGSAPRRPEAALAALRVRQLVDLDEAARLDPLDHQLGDPLTAHDLERHGRVGVDQQHLEFAPVAGVDQARRVEAGDTVSQGQAAAWLDEAGVALRNGDGGSGRHQGPTTTGCEGDVLGGDQVGASVTLPRVGRQREVVDEATQRDLEHRRTLAAGPRGPRSLPHPAPARRLGAMLAWMDLEMTGLDPATDVIVEVATLVTDDDLEVIAEGPDLVIHQPPEVLAHMGDVVREMHTTSGLLDEIVASTTTLEEAGAATLAFLQEHIPRPGTVPLCGNSIGTDRRFLHAWLPEIEDFLQSPSSATTAQRSSCPAPAPDRRRRFARRERPHLGSLA